MDTKQEAIEDFVALYEEKTGNLWENRDNFEKQPGKLYPLDIDYGEVFSCVFLKLCNDINFLNAISTLTVRNGFTYDDRQFDIEASPIYSRIGLHVI